MVEELMLSLSTLFSPSKYGLNGIAIISMRLHQFSSFLLTFIDDEAFLFSWNSTFTFSGSDSKYNLSCRKARPSHSLLNCISHLPSPKWQSIESSNHDTLVIFLLICSRWEMFLIVLIFLVFLLNMEDRLTSFGGLNWMHMANNFSTFQFSGWVF